MSIYQFDIVHYWPGIRDSATKPKVARVISDGTVEFGGRPCYRISKTDGGTDYVAVTHVELLARMDETTAYVRTASEALEVCDAPGVDFVVVEDNAERIKLQRTIKALRLA